MNFEFNLVFLGLFVLFLLGCLIVFLSYVLVLQEPDFEKVSAYECGFQPFEDARQKFDVRFYLVAILFIVFDLEIMFLFPWALCLSCLGLFGYWVMFVFLFLLLIAFVYEWEKGALDWT